MTPLESVAYEPSRRGELVELMARVWDDPEAGEHVEWWFEQSPVQPGVIRLVEVEGRLAGTLGASFLRMSIGGEEALAATPLRAASLPELRGRGIFTRVVADVEAAAREAGAKVGITTPNAASTGTFRKCGWEVVLEPRVWVRPLRLRAAPLGEGRTGPLRRRRVIVDPVERFGEEAAESWRRASALYGDSVVGDPDYLNWRYAEGPHDYRRFAATVDRRPGGYAVVRRKREHGLEAGMVCTLVADTGAGARLLLAAVADEMRGCQILAALPPRVHRAAFARAGYLPTPRTMTILAKPLAEGAALPRDLHYAFGDHDLV